MAKRRRWTDRDLVKILEAGERGDEEEGRRLWEALHERFGAEEIGLMTDRVEALRDERWECMEPTKRRGIVATRDRATLDRMLDEGVRPFGFSDPPRTPEDEGAVRQLGRVRKAVGSGNSVAAALAALWFAKLCERHTDRRLWPQVTRNLDAKEQVDKIDAGRLRGAPLGAASAQKGFDDRNASLRQWAEGMKNAKGWDLRRVVTEIPAEYRRHPKTKRPMSDRAVAEVLAEVFPGERFPRKRRDALGKPAKGPRKPT